MAGATSDGLRASLPDATGKCWLPSLQKDIHMDSKKQSYSFRINQSSDARAKEPMRDDSRCEALLDSTEAAQLLRIHPKTLQRMARKGEIPAMQIGKLWRFSPSALLLWQQEKLAG